MVSEFWTAFDCVFPLLEQEWEKEFPEKGYSWKEMSIAELFDRLVEEIVEFDNELSNNGNNESINEESIDIAMIALMLVERCKINVSQQEDSQHG